jgi:hypothetical protein
MKLKTKKQTAWIEITKDGLTARFLVSPLTFKENMDILNASKIKEWENNQRFESTDLFKFRVETVVKTIMDWEYIEDEEGNPIPCTKENKEMFYTYNATLAEEVLVKTQELAEDMFKQKEEERKN